MSAAYVNAKNFVEQNAGDLKQQEQLELYGLYKQAELGDVQDSRPGITQMKKRAKWEAWNSCKGMSQIKAKLMYIRLTKEIQKKE